MFIAPVSDYSFKARIPNVQTVSKVVNDFVLPIEKTRQTNSVGEVFKKGFKVLKNLQLQKHNEDAQLLLLELKGKLGIKSLGETLEEGIVFARKDKNVAISIPSENSLKLQTFDVKSGEVLDSFWMHNQKMVKSAQKNNDGFSFSYYQKDDEGLNTVLNSFWENLDEMDFSLLKLRMAVEKPEVQKEVVKFDPNQVALAIRKSEIERQSTKLKSDVSDSECIDKIRPYVFHERGILTSEQKLITDGIVAQFNSAHEKLLGIKNMMVRSKIKNGYGENLEKGVAGSKELRFVGIGRDDANVSVNMLNYQYKKHLIVKMYSADGEEKYFVTNPKGEVFKTPPLTLIFGRQPNNAENLVEFYSQSELEAFDMHEFLTPLHAELRKYNEHIDKSIEALEARRVRYSTEADVGSLLDERPRIEGIEEKYRAYKKNMLTLSLKSRHKIADKLGFDTINRPCVIMRGVGENVEDLCVSFPVFEGQKGLKIQVLGEKDTVTKTFYIMNDKLVKFESDNILSKKHAGRKVYYHSADELEHSGVRRYLDVIDKKLQEAMDVVTEHRNPTTKKALASLRKLKHKLSGHRKID